MTVERFAPQADEWTVYAIGDVHGRADLLRAFRDRIAEDVAASTAPQACLTVLVGDYVDRGPSSAEVLELLSSEPFPTRLVPLRGNHEQMLLDAKRSAGSFRQWARNGGAATLRSYGIEVPALLNDRACRDLQARMRTAIPARHRAFLESLPTHCGFGNYFFCHAGVRPGVPLDRQRTHDLLWIRDEFLNATGSFEKTVVHGHTPVPNVERHANRINLDTGAFQTGYLSGIKISSRGEQVMVVAA